jgi:hypothetical protein
MKERDNAEDLDVDWRIILERRFGNMFETCELDACRLVTGTSSGLL